jgi:hypothetical protein
VGVLEGTDAEELFSSLLHAVTEKEVVEALKARQLWDDRAAWRPYGDMPNNRGVVGNQQANPMAALVEKVVNSVDSILTAECMARGVDPKSAAAPRSMPEAVEDYFGIREGRLRNLSPIPRDLAEHIQLVATGTKDEPAYVIVDDGEGQQPDRFPETFLSLLRSNKTAIPFVQGKFNMGGTGVLQFAGENSFQLIASRRRPGIPVDGDPALASKWGFTLVRRFRPGPDEPQSVYVYLAPGGVIPRFDAARLPLRPGTYPAAFASDLEYGTCIKLWNYRLPGKLKSIATLDFRYALERALQEPALPIRLYERRPGYSAHSYETSVAGLAVVLANAGDDKEPGFDGGAPLSILGLGEVGLELSVIKEGEDPTKRYPAGVFMTVNGQTHGQLGTEFFKRRELKLDYIADSLIVRVDCTNLAPAVREDLFMASRDRMRDIPEKGRLEQTIQDYLADHQGLKDLNARRRQEAMTGSLDEDTASVLQELVKGDPTLASLFGSGSQIKLPTGPLPTPVAFSGKRFPTYFQLRKEPPGGLVRKTPKNWTVRIEFETDAANDYFSPGRLDRGRIEVGGLLELRSTHLWNGTATLRFELPTTANVGDRLRVDVKVMDESRVEPFMASFAVEVQDERPHEAWGGANPQHSGLGGLPNVVEVRQQDWARHQFDQYTAVKVMHAADGDGLDVFLNMDNLYLRNELARRRSISEDTVRRWFKYGLLVLALGMLYEQRQHRAEEAAEAPADQRDSNGNFASIAEATKGLAVTIIPLMAQLTRRLN